MSTFNFDEEINRYGTSCVKYDSLDSHFGTKDVLPMWVADMDFKTPPCVINAIKTRAEHPILGYTFADDSYYRAICDWQWRRHGWSITPHQIGFLPGIVVGMAYCIKAMTTPGDKILIQSPVYPPFRNLVEKNGRQVVCNSLHNDGTRFQIDFDDLEKKLSEGCKMMLLCNPHNPGGRIWEREELQQIARLCHRYGVLVVSDEIHADLALPGNKHLPFACVSEEAADNCITLSAPSKTLNMAGLGSSYFIAGNEAVRHKLETYLEASELNNGHLFAFCTAEAAYREGEAWLSQLLDYLAGNVRLVRDFMAEHLPQIKVMVPQASFLVWLDFRALQLEQPALVDFLLKKARLGLNDGLSFGVEGRGFMRMNVGTTRATVGRALAQLKKAIDEGSF